MQETHGAPEEGGNAESSDAVLPERRQPFIAIVVATMALAIVMILMLLAVRNPRAKETIDSGNRSANSFPQDYSSQISIEEHTYAIQTNAAGFRELRIDGFVRNAGKNAVRSADLRCRFRAYAGGEISKDIPLIVDSQLEEVDDGVLLPFTRREFHARIGEFPDSLEPELLQLEVVNVRILEP